MLGVQDQGNVIGITYSSGADCTYPRPQVFVSYYYTFGGSLHVSFCNVQKMLEICSPSVNHLLWCGSRNWSKVGWALILCTVVNLV